MRKINLFIGMVLTTVLLAACGQHNKPEFKGDISGENDLEQTQSYFTNGMHEVTKCPTGYYYMSEQEMAGVGNPLLQLEFLVDLLRLQMPIVLRF